MKAWAIECKDRSLILRNIRATKNRTVENFCRHSTDFGDWEHMKKVHGFNVARIKIEVIG